MRKPYLALAFVILLSLTILSSSALQTENIAILSSGSIIYPTNSLTDNNLIIRSQIYEYNQNQFSPEVLAAMTEMWIGHWYSLSNSQTIKAINPDVIAFVYFNTRHIWRVQNADYDEALLNLFKTNDWILKDSGNNYIQTYNGDAYVIDFGAPGYHTWLANWFKDYIDLYDLDGASLDNWQVSTIAFYGLPQTPINPRTGTDWTSQEVCDAYKALTLEIRKTIGVSKYVHVNGIFSGNHFYMTERINQLYIDGLLNGGVNAVTSEAIFSSFSSADWYTESFWLKGVNMAVWLSQNFLSLGGRIFATISENAGLHYPVGLELLPSGVTKEQYVTYCYASRLLTLENEGNYINFGTYMTEDYLQSLMKIELGTPSSAYYIVPDTHIYARDFSKVKILVNPTFDSYSLNISGNYETLEGIKVTSPLTIEPHTGIILKMS